MRRMQCSVLQKCRMTVHDLEQRMLLHIYVIFFQKESEVAGLLEHFNWHRWPKYFVDDREKVSDINYETLSFVGLSIHNFKVPTFGCTSNISLTVPIHILVTVDAAS